MARNLLQIVQQVARRHGLSNVPGVVDSKNETIVQLWGLANEAVEELNARYKWMEMVTALSFTHANGTDYGALQIRGIGSAVSDWRNYQPETLYQGSSLVYGPIEDREWTQGNPQGFRFYGDWLRIAPVPSDIPGTPYTLEYYSTCPIVDIDGNPIEEFTADTDLCKLPDRLVVLGLRWRYKKEKGLPYAEDKDTYELEVADFTSNTGQQHRLTMDGERCETGPMILVPRWGKVL